MQDLVDEFGDGRECVLGRELTKTFETFYSGTVKEVLAELEADPHGSRGGEFVVMVRGGNDVVAGSSLDLDVDKLLKLLVAEMPIKKAAKIVAEVSGIGKK